MNKVELLVTSLPPLYKRVARFRNAIAFVFLFWLLPYNLLATGPVFVITPDTINFGVLVVGEYTTGTVVISNIGDEYGEVAFGNITGPGSGFIWWIVGASWMMGPGSSLIYHIPCQPTATGTINAIGTIYTSDPQLPVFYLHFTGTVVTAVFTLSGVITYPNVSATPLTGMTVKLKDVNGIVINIVTTNNSGHYLFSHVQNGNYTLEISTAKPWGGVTALDLLLYQKHIAGIATLTGIKLDAGDVNGSGTLSALDILLIRKRIAGILNSFLTGDWLFNNGPVTINQTNVTYDFNGICYGDANGSYVPAGVKR